MLRVRLLTHIVVLYERTPSPGRVLSILHSNHGRASTYRLPKKGLLRRVSLSYERLLHIMNISFTSDTLVNSTVIDSATGQSLFELSASRHHFRIHLTMRDAQNNVVGEYKEGKSDTEVIYRGKTMRAREWLVKKHWYSRFVGAFQRSVERAAAHSSVDIFSSRTFMAHNGRAYEWKGSNQVCRIYSNRQSG